MAFYETVFIARQDISAKQAEELTEKFTTIVNDNGAKVTRAEQWGLRTLAYRVSKNRKGHYALLHIDGASEAIVEMERNMRLNEDVLRFMTIRLDEMPKEASIMMKASDGDSNDNDKPRR